MKAQPRSNSALRWSFDSAPVLGNASDYGAYSCIKDRGAASSGQRDLRLLARAHGQPLLGRAHLYWLAARGRARGGVPGRGGQSGAARVPALSTRAPNMCLVIFSGLARAAAGGRRRRTFVRVAEADGWVSSPTRSCVVGCGCWLRRTAQRALGAARGPARNWAPIPAIFSRFRPARRRFGNVGAGSRMIQGNLGTTSKMIFRAGWLRMI